ncbi:hypothetical protein D049_0654 [Vibrio parahaemolyticus VPTS-2010]|nr:hypothetical protein D049_0654 [Vibrio parahaemolyticus VPTS-2010]
MNAEFFCLLAQILTGDAQISASDDNSHTKNVVLIILFI